MQLLLRAIGILIFFASAPVFSDVTDNYEQAKKIWDETAQPLTIAQVKKLVGTELNLKVKAIQAYTTLAKDMEIEIILKKDPIGGDKAFLNFSKLDAYALNDDPILVSTCGKEIMGFYSLSNNEKVNTLWGKITKVHQFSELETKTFQSNGDNYLIIRKRDVQQQYSSCKRPYDRITYVWSVDPIYL